MKPISNLPAPILLKTILDIVFFLLVVGLVLSSVGSLILILLDEPISYEIMGVELKSFSTTSVILIILSIIFYLVFIYTIYRFRKLVRLFFRKKLFTKEQTLSLNIIGKLMVGLSIGKVILTFLVELLLTDSVGLNIKAYYFDSFWFILSIGLFFIYISKVFENARIIKEDHDLTI